MMPEAAEKSRRRYRLTGERTNEVTIMSLFVEDIGALLNGVVSGEDDAEARVIKGPDDVEDWIGAAVRQANPKAFLKTLSLAQSRLPERNNMHKIVTRIGKISKQVLVQTGRIEAEYMRRPNTLVGLQTTSLAPAATVAFSIQPGTGMSYYRLLSFISDDDSCFRFGFTSLKVGGVEHVNFTQSTPAAPVSSGVPWTLFMYREGRMVANLAPWSGQVFDSNTPITGTVANLTIAATGDAYTGGARGVFLCQTDPCGMRYQQSAQNAVRTWGALSQNLGQYSPLFTGG